MFSGTMNLNGKENRKVTGELNFFSAGKPNDHSNFPVIDRSSIVVEHENSHGEANPDVNTGLHLLTTANNAGSDQSTVEDGISSNMVANRDKNELVQVQLELERIHTDNQRLRGMLSQVTNNYNALQMHLVTLMQHQHHNKIVQGKSEEKKDEIEGHIVPRQFIELGPKSTLSHSTSEERTRSGSPTNTIKLSNNGTTNPVARDGGGERVGREESPESESWNPNKVPKLSAAASSGGVDHQPAEATMRKTRVSVRARSEAPMISDGCQWRKYGQKMAKGNPCPRAYYRCTMAAVGCPVRKQVQRCAEDRTILITTYEGIHNHPLPPAAMAMASTTSAAANMLLSGSMPSADRIMNQNLLARAILPMSYSMATISASPPFPTVTLDLTHPPNPLHYHKPLSQFQLPFPQNLVLPPPTPPPQVIFGQPLYNQSKFSGLHVSSHSNQSQPNTSFADTLSATTAAITADPNFMAAVAAAISTIMGGSSIYNMDNVQQ